MEIFALQNCCQAVIQCMTNYLFLEALGLIGYADKELLKGII